MGIITTSYLEMRKKEILEECKFFPLSNEATELRKRLAEVDMLDTDRGLEQIARISLEFSMTGHKSEELDDVLKYFDLMGEDERNLVRQWRRKQVAKTVKQREFFTIIDCAIFEIDYNYLIANIEPSLNGEGKICYKEGNMVADISELKIWEKKAREFWPQRGSSLATLHELFLWYAYRIAKGFWTLEYVCDDSTSAGNYYYAPGSSKKIEVSGKRIVGGARDGVGNTRKLVKRGEDNVICGGDYCKIFSHSVAYHSETYSSYWMDVTGVVVLRK